MPLSIKSGIRYIEHFDRYAHSTHRFSNPADTRRHELTQLMQQSYLEGANAVDAELQAAKHGGYVPARRAGSISPHLNRSLPGELERALTRIAEYESKAGETGRTDGRIAQIVQYLQKQAYLTGAAGRRADWGENLVLVVLRRTGTEDCARYVGRVFVDDVYSDGQMYQTPMGYSSWQIPAARFMRRARYPKLSEAVAGGLYHYGCKCWHVSYFEGVTPTDYQGESIPSFTWYALRDKEPSLPYGYDIQPYTNEDAVILLVREVMELRGMNPQRERGLVARTMSPRRVSENNPFEQRANQYLVSKFGANFAETNEAYQVYLTVLNILVDAAMMNGASPQSISDSFIDSMFATAFGERLNAADQVGAVITGLGLAAAAGGVAASLSRRPSAQSYAPPQRPAVSPPRKTVVNLNQKPIVSNERLRNIINDLYKGRGGPNQIGNGSTMDAVRNEVMTGLPTNGRFHRQKLHDYLNALRRRIRAGDLDDHDTKVAEALIRDILDAIGGF
ncbi:MAG: hypothetical protein FWE20_12035 [Defluviitaleaceae bacterium]|nr:hypothetical protein [Defluviitaleaceae bacterium]